MDKIQRQLGNKNRIKRLITSGFSEEDRGIKYNADLQLKQLSARHCHSLSYEELVCEKEEQQELNGFHLEFYIFL